MVSTPRFKNLAASQIAMHRDQSWGKANRWPTGIRRLFPKRRHQMSWAWVPLFLLSLSSWAFVLTGLNMATRESFRAGDTTGVQVVGLNRTNFNKRTSFSVLEAAFQLWKQGKEATLPAAGAVYHNTGKAIADSNDSVTAQDPLSSNKAGPIFLAPQLSANDDDDDHVPLTGTTWGLLFQYSCKQVTKLSEFTILSRRYNSTTPGYFNNTGLPLQPVSPIPPHLFYQVPDTDASTISRLQQLSSDQARFEIIAEVGLSQGIYRLKDDHRGYRAGSHGGLQDEEILEFALWQYFQPAQHDGLIPELMGEYYWRTDHQVAARPDTYFNLSAIGARCVSSSSTGSARVDGIAGTFSEFHQEDADEIFWNGDRYQLPRFGHAVPAVLLPGLRGDPAFDATNPRYVSPYNETYKSLAEILPGLEVTQAQAESVTRSQFPIDYRYIPTHGTRALNLTSPDWREALLASSGILDSAGTVDFSLDTGYLRHLTPNDLRRALEAAYNLVALALAYNQQQAPDTAWHHPNLAAAQPWVQLVPVGDSATEIIPVLHVVALSFLTLWSAGCLGLGLAYSFRKRWDAYFSTRSLYWYCEEAGIDPLEVMRA